MDVIKYRYYIVCDAKYCCIATGETIKWWPWPVRKMVRKGYSVAGALHAYYKHKVVVGYHITNSSVPYKVFLPAFSSYRESFLSRIRNDINKFAKFNVAIIRMKLYMKEIDKISQQILRKSLITFLPEAILNMIGLYCYDPFLLLK